MRTDTVAMPLDPQRREALVRRSQLYSRITLIHNSVEGIVSVAAGITGVAAETGVIMLIYLDHAHRDRHACGLICDRKDVDAAIEEGAVERVRKERELSAREPSPARVQPPRPASEGLEVVDAHS